MGAAAAEVALPDAAVPEAGLPEVGVADDAVLGLAPEVVGLPLVVAVPDAPAGDWGVWKSFHDSVRTVLPPTVMLSPVGDTL